MTEESTNEQAPAATPQPEPPQQERSGRRAYIFFPIFFALAMVIGMYLGSYINGGGGAELPGLASNNFTKLNRVINYVEREYVDSVDRQYLVDRTIENLLQELDPHSYYIPPEDLAALTEPLEGNFDGIGVEFSMQKDTVVVIAPVNGGPSEEVGIMAGDRIVSVEGETIAGVDISNKEVISKLRGQRGTKVNIEVARRGEKKLLPFAITRGKIPIYSVDVSYMMNDDVGYLKVSRFSKTTYEEFMEHGLQLKSEGMTKLVLDLRGNGGGFLETAIRMADEFLPAGQAIVYTQGKAHPKKSYNASSTGDFEDVELVVLIDEGSASASEIIAGAIQDNDRGRILGRKSFGKGLVQEQVDWKDGSAVRLTIARYYTPSGRCIQKPYDNGTDAYYEDYYDQFQDGGQHPDSIDYPDSLKFYTTGGRVVYGGGGITPDVYIERDTTGRSGFFSELLYRGIIRQFAFEYSDRERDNLNAYSDVAEFNQRFDLQGKVMDEFLSFASDNGIAEDQDGLTRSGELIANRLKANIARYIWNNDGYYPIIHERDQGIKRSVELLARPLNAQLPSAH